MAGLQQPSAELIAAVEHAGRAFSDIYTTTSQSAGAHVPAAQLRVLHAIEASEAPAISALATELRMGTPSVSRVCDRLEASGWAVRQPGQEDRRQIRIRLTPRGRRLLADLRRRRRKSVEDVLAAMPPAQQRALQRGLAAFAAASGVRVQPARGNRASA
ncbi:MarR family winged helix-turn-helix transcriptional regulator [Actinocatenispora rupis]|uniref:HTH marR-type domain-containing protein n=1 Tax=Actinocatenispora rupis TaxID=519421 RepID=A0A8J3J5Q1_9ACTN|nr:MarR family transcriptional regulator [Actinocatenispora rupis]GID16376.1 hypothetical protein Aru02nite_72650 [Actinocatenispora rupis]